LNSVFFFIQERTVENAHGGGAIWSICQTSSGISGTSSEQHQPDGITLLTGGSDSAVQQWQFTSSCGHQSVPEELRFLNAQPADLPKLVASIGDAQVVVLTDRGVLYLASGHSSDMLEVYRDQGLASYAVMSVLEEADDDGQLLLLLGNLAGQVQLLNITTSGQLTKVLEAPVATGKIFSAALLSPAEFLVCDGSRQLGLWNVVGGGGDAVVGQLASGRLPEMKHAWFTVARKWGGEQWYVVGDRCGGVRFYTRIDSCLEARHEFHRIHGANGVTDIRVIK
jgi:WD40 repeat protein